MNTTTTKARAYWQGEGKNFMTPSVIEYIDAPNGKLIELSQGTGFDNEPIYGVSVADADGTRLYEPDSQMFHDLDDARAHILAIGF